MSADPQPPGQPEPGPSDPTSPQPSPWPQQRTRPQTWPERPTVPQQPGPPPPPAWPARPPGPRPDASWPQQPAPPQQASWPRQAGSPQPPPDWPRQPAGPRLPGPYGPGAAGQERYAVRPPADELYGQQYGYDQQPLEWSPPPMHGYGMQRMTVAPKNPALSVLLSVFIPGLGSMVNDNVGVGVAILILNLVGLVLSLVLIGVPLAIGTWIWGLVDAYRSAQRWNHAHGIIS